MFCSRDAVQKGAKKKTKKAGLYGGCLITTLRDIIKGLVGFGKDGGQYLVDQGMPVTAKTYSATQNEIFGFI